MSNLERGSETANEVFLDDWMGSPDDPVLAAVTGSDGHVSSGDKAEVASTFADATESISQRPAGRWFSAFGQRASAFGSKAVQVIASEAKLMAADAKDFQAGVREGWQLTTQDARQFGERIRHAREERAGTGAAPACDSVSVSANPSSSSSPSTSTGPEASDRPEGLAAIRQGLAVTADVSKDLWRDVRESAPEAVRDLRDGIFGVHHKLLGLRGRSQEPTSASSPAAQEDGKQDEEEIDNDLFEIGSDDDLDEPFDFLDGNASDGTSASGSTPRPFNAAPAKKMSIAEPKVQSALASASSPLSGSSNQ
mmetsp:Transcript_87204/g.182492  ORF Transcript_87204/g.182492 Transcript_87204/m.182492 type:complete len:309 (+) Transcript_87204:187-1113(+)